MPCTKNPKICTCCRVSKDKIFFYHSSKMVKSGPGFDVWHEHSPVQIDSSSPYILTIFKCDSRFRTDSLSF